MIYIAGQITGLPHEVAYKNFESVEMLFKANGIEAINPMKLGLDHLSYEEQLAKCFEVIERDASSLYLLSNWQKSEGAKREFQLVGNINLRRKHGDRIYIFYEREDGPDTTVEAVKCRKIRKSIFEYNS